MVIVRKASLDDMEKLKISSGFSRWFSSHDEKGKSELKEFLKDKLKEGLDLYLAIDNDEVVGFIALSNWPTVPGGKAIEALEVAKPYRGRGTGSMILKEVLKDWDTIMVLTPSAEEGYEEELESFYKRFGFRPLTEEYMVRIPEGPQSGDKLRKWIHHIDRLIEIY